MSNCSGDSSNNNRSHSGHGNGGAAEEGSDLEDDKELAMQAALLCIWGGSRSGGSQPHPICKDT
eukprot:scaffold170065_cov20-Tisochrysis_lutea.AAC.2